MTPGTREPHTVSSIQGLGMQPLVTEFSIRTPKGGRGQPEQPDSRVVGTGGNGPRTPGSLDPRQAPCASVPSTEQEGPGNPCCEFGETSLTE